MALQGGDWGHHRGCGPGHRDHGHRNGIVGRREVIRVTIIMATIVVVTQDIVTIKTLTRPAL